MVVALIEERARLLPGEEIDIHDDVPLAVGHRPLEAPRKQALLGLKALEAADGAIRAVDDRPGLEVRVEELDPHRLALLGALDEELHREAVAEAIHHQAGQQVGLTVHHSVGRLLGARPPPQGIGRLEAGAKEGLVDPHVGPVEPPEDDLRVAGEEGLPEEPGTRVFDPDDLSAHERRWGRLHVGSVDPRVARLPAFDAALGDSNGRLRWVQNWSLSAMFPPMYRSVAPVAEMFVGSADVLKVSPYCVYSKLPRICRNLAG